MRRLSLSFLFLFITCFFLIPDVPALNSKSLEFDYRIIVRDIPSDASQLKIWIPYLPQTPYQIIEDVKIEPENNSIITFDQEYKNRILHYAFNSPVPSFVRVNIHYKVKRLEYSKDVKNGVSFFKDERDNKLERYLKADQLVTISPQIEELASVITQGKKTTLEKAKAIYNYVFENVSYDKTISGWGYGDTERVCRVKTGNCTDFHSLFISLARASRIPAKFVIGASIPKGKEAQTNSYHCWAEFYDEKLGWVPVDISEAWKDKSKREYYFGTVSEDRLEFTEGRDIILEPSQNGGPLNYFVYPYVEVDGEAFGNVEISFRFKDRS